MIHQTALIESGVRLGQGVTVGPYSVVGADVEIGARTSIGSHAVITGPTRIGERNVIHAHACLGGAPQDLEYRDQPTRLEIGDRNVIREFVTMHRGSSKDLGVTRVGNDGFFMAYSHIAHDCDVGNQVIMANGATLGGHVQVGDRANIAGLVAVHQFVRIGRLAMVGGGSIVVKDVPPFTMAAGDHARLRGLNRRGLQRADFPPATVQALKQAYRMLFRCGLTLEQACSKLRDVEAEPVVAELLAFLQHSWRGVMR